MVQAVCFEYRVRYERPLLRLCLLPVVAERRKVCAPAAALLRNLSQQQGQDSFSAPVYRVTSETMTSTSFPPTNPQRGAHPWGLASDASSVSSSGGKAAARGRQGLRSRKAGGSKDMRPLPYFRSIFILCCKKRLFRRISPLRPSSSSILQELVVFRHPLAPGGRAGLYLAGVVPIRRGRR